MLVYEVGVRELRNNVSALLRRAGRGERIVVTVDGRPVAQLGPLEPDNDGLTLDDLVAAGLVEPPSRSSPAPPTPEFELPADVSVDRLLDEIRGRG